MAALTTLALEADETVRPVNANGTAPPPNANPRSQSKRNNRRHRNAAEEEETDTPDSAVPRLPEIPVPSDDDPRPDPTDLVTTQEPTVEQPLQPVPPVENNSSECDVAHQPESTNQEEAAAGTDLVMATTLTPEAIASIAYLENVRFFQDQHGIGFAWIKVPDVEQKHFECLRIRSRPFLSRLLALISSRTETPPKLSTVKQAIELLELDAYRTPKRKLDNRRAAVDDEIFIDLGDDNWRMLRVNRQGWSVENQDEPRFFRPQHMLPLTVPEPGGDLDDVFTYVPAESDGEKLLLKAWLLGGLYAAIPNPILLLVGQQGSAKTTRSRRLRSLLDPSVTPVLGDLEMSNLFLTFQHHAVPCFENVSHFNRREADMFCRAVTGNGTERRKLYTDGDQVLYSFRRAIIINGIDTPSTRPDFLDRCLIINCRRMDQFITLDELDRQFESARPRLFGAMLDLLVKTLSVLHQTPAATEFRMADFARFGRAVAVALGNRPEDFDTAYRLKIQQQGFDALEDAPMARLLEKFAARLKKPWEGTAEELLAKLKYEAHVSSDTDAGKDLPKSARWLSSRLGELAPALKNRQVDITKQPRTNAKRLWKISSAVAQDPNAEPDDIFQVLEDAAMEDKST